MILLKNEKLIEKIYFCVQIKNNHQPAPYFTHSIY